MFDEKSLFTNLNKLQKPLEAALKQLENYEKQIVNSKKLKRLPTEDEVIEIEKRVKEKLGSKYKPGMVQEFIKQMSV